MYSVEIISSESKTKEIFSQNLILYSKYGINLIE